MINKLVVVFALLGFSLLLFGCLNQGGSNAADTASNAQVGQATQATDVDTAASEVTATVQDLNDLELNESDFA